MQLINTLSSMGVPRDMCTKITRGDKKITLHILRNLGDTWLQDKESMRPSIFRLDNNTNPMYNSVMSELMNRMKA